MLLTRELRSAESIQPTQLYSFVAACNFIPSALGDGPICLATLHNWRVEGRFAAEYRPVGKRKFWFVRGEQILKLIGVAPRRPRSAGPEKARATDVERLRKKGLIDT